MSTKQRVIIRVLPEEDTKVAEVLEKIYYSDIEGILPPAEIDSVVYVKSTIPSENAAPGVGEAETAKLSAAAPSSAAPNVDQEKSTNTNGAAAPQAIMVSDEMTTHLPPNTRIIERRIAFEYDPADNFPLLVLLNPENEMLPEMSEREELAINLLDTMVEAHAIGLYHGQLNSERVLVHPEDPQCFLTDFFVGKAYNPYVCPRDYRGPESILRCEKKDMPEKVDVWAMGCLLYELLSTEPLFTLPSSRDEVGVTIPMFISHQIGTIVARTCHFLNNRLADDDGVAAVAGGSGNVSRTTKAIFQSDFDQYAEKMLRITKECDSDPALKRKHLNPTDPRRVKRDYLESRYRSGGSSNTTNGNTQSSSNSSDNGSSSTGSDSEEDASISEPFSWAIQQCLTLCPSVRPSLKEIRDGLMRKLGKSEDEIRAKEAQLRETAKRVEGVAEAFAANHKATGEDISPLAKLIHAIRQQQ